VSDRKFFDSAGTVAESNNKYRGFPPQKDSNNGIQRQGHRPLQQPPQRGPTGQETQVIEEAKFKTFGCGSAIASSSLATEWIKGRTVDDALAIKNTDIVKELSLPPVKIHCSVLAEDAIRAAIGDWKKKNGAPETVEAAAVAK